MPCCVLARCAALRLCVEWPCCVTGPLDCCVVRASDAARLGSAPCRRDRKLDRFPGNERLFAAMAWVWFADRCVVTEDVATGVSSGHEAKPLADREPFDYAFSQWLMVGAGLAADRRVAWSVAV